MAPKDRRRQKRIAEENRREQVVAKTHAVTQHNGNRLPSDLLTAMLTAVNDEEEYIPGAHAQVQSPPAPTPTLSPPPLPQPSPSPSPVTRPANPPPTPTPVQQQNPFMHFVHRWIPQTIYGLPLSQFPVLTDLLRMWSRRHIFDPYNVENEDSNKSNIHYYLQIFNMH